jgi:hypothetical protein
MRTNMARWPDASCAAIVAEGASKLFLDGAVVAFHQMSFAVKRNEIMSWSALRLRQDRCCAVSRGSPN